MGENWKRYRLMTLPLSLEREGLAGVLEEDVTAVAMITFKQGQGMRMQCYQDEPKLK